MLRSQLHCHSPQRYFVQDSMVESACPGMIHTYVKFCLFRTWSLHVFTRSKLQMKHLGRHPSVQKRDRWCNLCTPLPLQKASPFTMECRPWVPKQCPDVIFREWLDFGQRIIIDDVTLIVSRITRRIYAETSPNSIKWSISQQLSLNYFNSYELGSCEIHSTLLAFCWTDFSLDA